MAAVSGGGTKTFGVSSTVNYAGTGQTVSSDTYGDLTFSGSGTKTMTLTGAAINGTLDFEGTATATITGTGTRGVKQSPDYPREPDGE